MRLSRRFPAALAAACLIASPALATNSSVTLTTSWQKISPPCICDVQNISGQVFLATSSPTGASGLTAPAPADTVPGQMLLPGEHRCFYTPFADLYAKTGSVGAVVIMDNLTCPH